jgi:hypothetical protein
MQPSFTSLHICIVVAWARSTIDGGQIAKISQIPFASLKRNRSAIWFAPGSASTAHLKDTWRDMSGSVRLRPRSASTVL